MAVEVAEKTVEELAAEEAEALARVAAEKEEADALNQFVEGFTGEPVKLTDEELKAAEEAKAAEAAHAETERLAAEEAAKVPEVTLATPSVEEFQDLVKKANSVDQIRVLAEKVRDTTSGRVGSLEQIVKQLQEATPVGHAITVTPEDFVEIGKEMPEHAKMLADGLTRVLSKFKGTGTPVSTPVETPEEFARRVDARIAERDAERLLVQQEQARRELTILHPDWETVIGPKDSDTEFRKYLKTQPGWYENTILSANEPVVLDKALTKFKAVQEEKLKKPPKAAVPNPREERLREAVQVRGGASPLNTKRDKTDDEQFAEGFNS